MSQRSGGTGWWWTTYLGDSRPQEGADQIFESLQLGLDDDEAEVGLGVRIPRLLLHPFDLRPGTGVKSRRRGGPGRGRLTCFLVRSSTRSTSSVGQGRISGALRSVTHARVSACKSRVSGAVACSPTEAKMSSMSMGSQRTSTITSSPELVPRDPRKSQRKRDSDNGKWSGQSRAKRQKPVQ